MLIVAIIMVAAPIQMEIKEPTRTLLKKRTTIIVTTTAVQGSQKEQISLAKPFTFVLNATNLSSWLEIATPHRPLKVLTYYFEE